MSIAIIISIISLLFSFFILLYLKWYIKRRISAEELLGEYRTEVNRLNAEIDFKTDRDSRLVEDRINKLKAVLEETDKRIATYVRELDRSRQGEALYTSLGRGIRVALKTPEPQVPQEAQTLPAKADVQPEPKPPSKRQLRAQIGSLVNEGLSPGEIASRLGISVAEVDLALNLLRRKS